MLLLHSLTVGNSATVNLLLEEEGDFRSDRRLSDVHPPNQRYFPRPLLCPSCILDSLLITYLILFVSLLLIRTEILQSPLEKKTMAICKDTFDLFNSLLRPQRSTLYCRDTEEEVTSSETLVSDRARKIRDIDSFCRFDLLRYSHFFRLGHSHSSGLTLIRALLYITKLSFSLAKNGGASTRPLQSTVCKPRNTCPCLL